MILNTWNFPKANGGAIVGISSGDEETFKRFPFKSFAREIIQNSIDVADNIDEPVRVEFSEFQIKKADIPGLEAYKEALKRSRDFWAHKPDYVKIYDEMISYIEENNKISCLRISDFNTTGLVGIDSIQPIDNNYLALVKGSGYSSKKAGAVTGGSKGLGKNAAFILSQLKMVFYSTITNGKKGYIGVTKLVSGFTTEPNAVQNRNYTQGPGYFSDNSDNCGPIFEDLQLDFDSDYIRDEQGTDVYIVGFKRSNTWKNDVIKEIINSFFYAIYKGKLEVSIDDILINKENLPFLAQQEFIKENKTITALYDILFNSENVQVFSLETLLGPCDLHVKMYPQDQQMLATNKCFMVRHPGMLIKDETFGNYNFSAMCFIDNNLLGQKLLSIENPQHTDWEPNRIEDIDEKIEVKRMIADLKTQIKEIILKLMGDDIANPIDPLGAGDYLPDLDSEGDTNKDKETQKDHDSITTITKITPNRTPEKNPNVMDEGSDGLQPTEGDIENEPGEVEHPDGTNEGTGGDVRPGDNSGTLNPGENIVLKHSELKGVRFKIISTNKQKGKFRIIFISPETKDAAFLKLSLVDDNHNTTPIVIKALSVNGSEILSKQPMGFRPFQIQENTKYILDVTTSEKSYFASEVKILCK